MLNKLSSPPRHNNTGYAIPAFMCFCGQYFYVFAHIKKYKKNIKHKRLSTEILWQHALLSFIDVFSLYSCMQNHDQTTDGSSWCYADD